MRWLGHVARQADSTPLNSLLFAQHVVSGTGERVRAAGGVGKQQQTWNACARSDLLDLSERKGQSDLLPVKWFEDAQIREKWSLLSERRRA